MGKETLVIFFGVWVALQAFLGFPLAWDIVVYIFLGIAILGLGIILRHEAIKRHRTLNTPETFKESIPAHSPTSNEDLSHDEVPRV